MRCVPPCLSAMMGERAFHAHPCPEGIRQKSLAYVSQGQRHNIQLVTFGNLSIIAPMNGTLEHGFASPAFAGFAFIGCLFSCKYIINWMKDSLQPTHNPRAGGPCSGPMTVDLDSAASRCPPSLSAASPGSFSITIPCLYQCGISMRHLALEILENCLTVIVTSVIL